MEVLLHVAARTGARTLGGCGAGAAANGHDASAASELDRPAKTAAVGVAQKQGDILGRSAALKIAPRRIDDNLAANLPKTRAFGRQPASQFGDRKIKRRAALLDRRVRLLQQPI